MIIHRKYDTNILFNQGLFIIDLINNLALKIANSINQLVLKRVAKRLHGTIQ